MLPSDIEIAFVHSTDVASGLLTPCPVGGLRLHEPDDGDLAISHHVVSSHSLLVIRKLVPVENCSVRMPRTWEQGETFKVFEIAEKERGEPP
jgi:hypothetical protein